MNQNQQSKITNRLSRHRAICAAHPQCDVAAQLGRELLADCLTEALAETKQTAQRGLLLFERNVEAVSSYADGIQWNQIPFIASTGLTADQIVQIRGQGYEVLLSNLAFDWVDAGGFIQSLHSLLSDDGRFWFSCFGAGTAGTTRSILASLGSHARFNDFFELQDVGDALFSAGFKDVSVSSTEFKLEYTTFEVLMADAHRIFGLNMDSQGQSAVCDRVTHDRATYRALKERVESCIREQGVYVEKIEIMIAHGRKTPAASQGGEIPVTIGTKAGSWVDV